MGWTYASNTKSKDESLCDYFIRTGVLRWSAECKHTYRVLDSALQGMRTFYAAVEMVDKETGKRDVWAAVILVRFTAGEIGHKDMDETMGPCEDNCPERILKLLTPTDSEYANDWRRRCWAKINARKARPKIEPGRTITIYGKDYKVTAKLEAKRGYRIESVDSGETYRLSIAKARQVSAVR